MFGDYGEFGPFIVNEDGTVVLRDIAWNKIAHLIFVDQPVKVGFSHSEGKNLKLLGRIVIFEW